MNKINIVKVFYLDNSINVLMDNGSKYFLNKDAQNDTEMSLNKFEMILMNMALSKVYDLKNQIQTELKEFSYGREITISCIDNELRRRKVRLNRKSASKKLPEGILKKASDLIGKEV